MPQRDAVGRFIFTQIKKSQTLQEAAMSDLWAERAFTADEAATISGVRRGTLGMWLIREPDILFSGKVGGRRVFSPKDITILATARELERGGMVLLTAIACAFEHLDEPPSDDAILLVHNGQVAHNAGRLIADRDVPRITVDKSIQLIPIGIIAARVRGECAAIYGGASVAVQT
ncbi:MAG: MerR family transcriptional regulator [Mesorhizobium sp.]|nr:MAG: MerR family transcriptional regulator [Mesorhizobium sp.]